MEKKMKLFLYNAKSGKFYEVSKQELVNNLDEYIKSNWYIAIKTDSYGNFTMVRDFLIEADLNGFDLLDYLIFLENEKKGKNKNNN